MTESNQKINYFLGSDVEEIVQRDRATQTENLIDYLLKEGHEIDPHKIRELSMISVQFPEMQNANLQELLRRFEVVKKHLSIEGDEGIKLDTQDVKEFSDFLAYSILLLQRFEDRRLMDKGANKELRQLLLRLHG